MYQAKIGNHPRIPKSEWSGYGFSKTHMNLFPTQEAELGSPSTDPTNNANDSGVHEEINNNSIWTTTGTSESSGSSTCGSLKEKFQKTPEAGGPMIPNKTPLGPQTSNLLDFTSARASTDVSLATDLPALFVQNGLEKYIGMGTLQYSFLYYKSSYLA